MIVSATLGLKVPMHLNTAHHALRNHEQTTRRAITVDEFATRMSITPPVAAHLLQLVDQPAPLPHRPDAAWLTPLDIRPVRNVEPVSAYPAVAAKRRFAGNGSSASA
jgi:hypothetical protein